MRAPMHLLAALIALGTPDAAIFPRKPDPEPPDPATLGCLLALVREAWSSPDLRVRRVGQRTLWEVERWDSAQVRYVHVADGPSEVAALVAALEALFNEASLGAERAAAERERYDATVKRVVDELRRRDGAP